MCCLTLGTWDFLLETAKEVKSNYIYAVLKTPVINLVRILYRKIRILFLFPANLWPVNLTNQGAPSDLTHNIRDYKKNSGYEQALFFYG